MQISSPSNSPIAPCYVLLSSILLRNGCFQSCDRRAWSLLRRSIPASSTSLMWRSRAGLNSPKQSSGCFPTTCSCSITNLGMITGVQRNIQRSMRTYFSHSSEIRSSQKTLLLRPCCGYQLTVQRWTQPTRAWEKAEEDDFLSVCCFKGVKYRAATEEKVHEIRWREEAHDWTIHRPFVRKEFMAYETKDEGGQEPVIQRRFR